MRRFVSRALLLSISAAAIGASVAWFVDVRHRRGRPVYAPAGAATATPDGPTGTSWLVAGGGGQPASNQISIERDLQLAVDVFGGRGRLLFAGGPKSDGVQVLEPGLQTDTLLRDLGQLFDPRAGRDARYRRTTLMPDGDATRATIEREARQLVLHGDTDVLLYLAGHGEQGVHPADNAFVTWGGGQLAVADLAPLLDQAPSGRTVRLVASACYSGGFAELAFVGADDQAGVPATNRCGLFATTQDQPSSGCDPNPDRRQHQGYGLHFLNALRGLDRNERELPAAAVDFDGDGSVSLLEAHARARIASRSIDIPTTTSERWLRYVAPPSGPLAKLDLPEEDAVVAAMTSRTGLHPDLRAAHASVAALDGQMETVHGRLEEARRREDVAFREATAEVLALWPVLDDPWHPEFARTLSHHRTAIERHLGSSVRVQRLWSAMDEVDRLAAELERLRTERAPLVRLERALENRLLAGRLRRVGGRDWQVYESFLACERWVPPLRR